jgi:biotin synthase-related radical SAM superfamily protein
MKENSSWDFVFERLSEVSEVFLSKNKETIHINICEGNNCN